MASRFAVVAICVGIATLATALPTSPDAIVPESQTPAFAMKKLPLLALWKVEKPLRALWNSKAGAVSPQLMEAVSAELHGSGSGAGMPPATGSAMATEPEGPCAYACPASCMDACDSACSEGLNAGCKQCAKTNGCEPCLECHMQHMQGGEGSAQPQPVPGQTDQLAEAVCQQIPQGATLPEGSSGVFFPGNHPGDAHEGTHVMGGGGEAAPQAGVFCDCADCAQAFKHRGGCQKWLAGDGAGVMAAIPAGCFLCGDEAARECGLPAEIADANSQDGTDAVAKDTEAINSEAVCHPVSAGDTVPAGVTGVFFPDSAPPVFDGIYVKEGTQAPEGGKFCDCSACVDAFQQEGGCEMWADGRDPRSAVPPGCMECKAEAADRCGIGNDEGCAACCQCPGFPAPTMADDCHEDRGCLDHCTEGTTCSMQCGHFQCGAETEPQHPVEPPHADQNHGHPCDHIPPTQVFPNGQKCCSLSDHAEQDTCMAEGHGHPCDHIPPTQVFPNGQMCCSLSDHAEQDICMAQGGPAAGSATGSA